MRAAGKAVEEAEKAAVAMAVVKAAVMGAVKEGARAAEVKEARESRPRSRVDDT